MESKGFFDKAYGTHWTRTDTTIRLREWGAGKNAGWAYVTLAREFDVQASVNGGGLVAKSPFRGTYPWGAVVQLTAYPSPGWVFDSWSGDISETAPSVFVPIDRDKSVTARFRKVGSRDIVQKGGNGAAAGATAFAVGKGYSTGNTWNWNTASAAQPDCTSAMITAGEMGVMRLRVKRSPSRGL